MIAYFPVLSKSTLKRTVWVRPEGSTNIPFNAFPFTTRERALNYWLSLRLPWNYEIVETDEMQGELFPSYHV
jgi:hypothetical protein